MQTNSKRVLNREGARELTPQEVVNISGGARTTTVCTFDPTTKTVDGDVGEC